MKECKVVFGPPKICHSDNGKGFDNQFFEELAQSCPGMQLIKGRLRHPQSQGSVEAANKVVERKLAAEFEETGSRDWPSMLAGIAWAMNTVPTPYEVVFGTKPREQILRPGTTYEEQPLIDDEDVADLLNDRQQPAQVDQSVAEHDHSEADPEHPGNLEPLSQLPNLHSVMLGLTCVNCSNFASLFNRLFPHALLAASCLRLGACCAYCVVAVQSNLSSSQRPHKLCRSLSNRRRTSCKALPGQQMRGLQH